MRVKEGWNGYPEESINRIDEKNIIFLQFSFFPVEINQDFNCKNPTFRHPTSNLFGDINMTVFIFVIIVSCRIVDLISLDIFGI